MKRFFRCAGLTTVLVSTLSSPALANQATERWQQSDQRSRVSLPVILTQENADVPPQTLPAETSAVSITELYAHNQGNIRAITLFVKELPVLTFLDEQTALAEPLAAEIDLLSSSNADATTITVHWNPEKKVYEIRAAQQVLVEMNENIQLAGTTKDIAEDALHITNRLRRLLGNAAPLRQIAGRPKPPKPAPAVAVAPGRVISTERGEASWYGGYFHGRRTASGEIYNQYALTAAHKRLRFGTKVRVTNLRNGKSVIVRITDRGPFIRGRIIDLSRKAAQAIGMLKSGVAPVTVEVLGQTKR